MQRKFLASTLGLALVVLAACSEGEGSSPSSTTSSPSAATSSGSAPAETSAGVAATEPTADRSSERCTETVPGSKLTFGAFASTGQLDPTKFLGGIVGGTEAAALYDTLFTYDAVSKEVVPHLAEGIESNEDFTGFTLRLRAGITFSDGTPLDAPMVARNFARYLSADVFTPHAGMMKAFYDSSQVVDATSLTVKMKLPWSEFPVFLAEQIGMMVNVNLAEADPSGFAANPPNAAGVGPYVLERNSPGEEVVLTARSDYWGGPVCIQSIRVVGNNSAQVTYESFKNRELDLAFVRDSAVIAEARRDGTAGLFGAKDGGFLLMLNHRPGNAGHDVRAREAIWKAIDPVALNERVFAGARVMTSAILSSQSPWASDAQATVPFDKARAAQLVEELRGDGGDTTIDLLVDDRPQSSDEAIAIEAFLEAVGFEVNIVSMAFNEKLLQVAQSRFEMTINSLDIEPAQIATRLYIPLHSGLVTNRGAYESTKMDAALEDAMRAKAEDRAAAIQAINDVYVAEFVHPSFANAENAFVWQPSVHGVIISPTDIALLYDAYLSDD